MKMIKYMVWMGLMVWGSTGLQANMNMQIDSMKSLPFITAPIEKSDPLSKSDIEKYMAMVDKSQRHKEIEAAMKVGDNKAVSVLKPGVSYDTYIAKSIELSGQKAKLDSFAKEKGYADGVDLFITITRITRAMMSIKMEEKFAQMPKEQQAMARSMMSGMMGKSSAEDKAAVKPYASKLMVMMEKAGNTR